jgi:hypothetical protein
MPVLSLLLSLTLQDPIVGWRCSVDRTVSDHSYHLSQAVEGRHRFPRRFRIDWLSAPFRVARFVEWIDVNGTPPRAPRTINLSVPASRRDSRAVLRIVSSDGTGRLLSNDPARWTIQTASSTSGLLFQSLDPDLNRQLWAMRNFRAVAEDRRGRVLGALDIRFPDPAEAERIAAELDREIDGKLRDPANPANRCNSYGAEAYTDPV